MSFSKKNNLIIGVILTLIAYVFFATSSTLIKAFPNEFPIIQIVFFQNIICLFLTIIYRFFRNKKISFRTKTIKNHLIRDVFGLISILFYYLAIKKIHLVDATTLAYTAPFFTPFVWKMWSRSKIEKDVWWAIILGFIGIVLILHPSSEIIKTGSILGLLAGIFSAVALSALRRINQKSESLFLTLQYLFTVGSIILLPFALIEWQMPTPIEWYFIIAIGISSFFAQILLTIAYRHGTASFLSPISYSMIFFVGMFSWLIFNQIPGILSIVGSLFIIIGGSFTYILRKRAKSISEALQTEEEKKWWKKLFHRKKD